jgi:protein-tyrosine kinase
MSSLIEQAAQRLEQLRQAGISVPEIPADRQSVAPPPAATPEVVPGAPVAEAAVAAPVAPARARAPAPDLPSGEPGPSTKRVELDLTMLANAGFVAPNAPRNRLADQYRVIKRPLIANAMAKGSQAVTHGNLIMVTSALSGEGKSFTSINLALSIAAELDHTVMLVDADVARPSVLRMLGQSSGPGLLDILEGKVDMASVLLRTNVDKLTILPSGSPHPKATELLASEAMKSLLEDMATRYPDRIIIFDSPPLLLTTESRVLATHMGQIVVVVRADHTLQSVVQSALSTIEACPVKMAVLNQARGDAEGSYGTGQGYGYGYGESYGAPRAEAAETQEKPKRSWLRRRPARDGEAVSTLTDGGPGKADGDRPSAS